MLQGNICNVKPNPSVATCSAVTAEGCSLCCVRGAGGGRKAKLKVGTLGRGDRTRTHQKRKCSVSGGISKTPRETESSSISRRHHYHHHHQSLSSECVTLSRHCLLSDNCVFSITALLVHFKVPHRKHIFLTCHFTAISGF